MSSGSTLLCFDRCDRNRNRILHARAVDEPTMGVCCCQRDTLTVSGCVTWRLDAQSNMQMQMQILSTKMLRRAHRSALFHWR